MRLLAPTTRALRLRELARLADRAARAGVDLTWSPFAAAAVLELEGAPHAVRGVVESLTVGGVLATAERGEA